MFGGFVAIYGYEKERLALTEQTLATITKIESWSDDARYLTIQFTEKETGNQITTGCIVDLLPSYNVGDRITILYDPQNPVNAILPSSRREDLSLGLTGSILGGVALAVGVALMKGWVKVNDRW